MKTVWCAVGLVLCAIGLCDGVTRVVSSVGCFEDSQDRVWKDGPHRLADNTPSLCKNLCAGRRYAGVEAGALCFCGDALPTTRPLPPTTSCNRPCPGDRRVTCGGQFGLEVYHVTPAGQNPALLDPGTHMGCYADQPDRVWKTGLHRLVDNRPQLCRNLCVGHRYYGLQGRVWCLCGDHLPPTRYGQSACKVKCQGMLEVTCGGYWTMDVYDTDPNAVAPTPPPPPPADTSHGNEVGCFEDRQQDRVWKNGINVVRNNNSPGLCMRICRGHQFAGLEAGIQCFCGDVLPTTSLPRSLCNKPCDGEKGTTCGGHLALQVYRAVDTGGQGDRLDSHLGCFQDYQERVWKNGLNRLDRNSPQLCRNLCAGFKFYGLEDGYWCLCGDAVPPRQIAQVSCGITCPGSPGHKCGGVLALDVFRTAGTGDHHDTTTLSPVGCFEDNKDRVWKNGVNTLTRNTPDLCREVCRGFQYVGVERGVWCMCGNTLPSLPLPPASCKRPCPGDTTRTCGGTWGLEVFQVAHHLHLPVRTQGNGLDTHLGCFQDFQERVWKNGLNRLERNSPQVCRNLCAGFKYYGLEDGYWCLCGNTLPPRKLAPGSCGMNNCPGAPGKKCGGTWSMDVYETEAKVQQGAPPPGAVAPCGRRHRRPGPGVVQLTSGGTASELGEAPWHVGIYRAPGGDQAYTQICGGTLVTPRHIITAAHCFWDGPNRVVRPAAEYKVAAGKYLRGWDEAEEGLGGGGGAEVTQRRDVGQIHVHPLYAAFDKFLAYDLAVLRVTRHVQITWAVDVVCLDWDRRLEEAQLAPNSLGMVTGWELAADVNRPTDVLKTVRLPYVPYDACSSLVDDKFKPFLTHDKLCAGFVNKSVSVCGGDSGGGYVFPHRLADGGKSRQSADTNTAHYLRGVASVGHLPTDYTLSVCNNQQLAGFTAISSYMPWIADTIKQAQ